LTPTPSGGRRHRRHQRHSRAISGRDKPTLPRHTAHGSGAEAYREFIQANYGIPTDTNLVHRVAKQMRLEGLPLPPPFDETLWRVEQMILDAETIEQPDDRASLGYGIAITTRPPGAGLSVAYAPILLGSFLSPLKIRGSRSVGDVNESADSLLSDTRPKAGS
jgi:hypothetical protein